MLQAFVFERAAVIVTPWHEPAEPPERGARVEIRSAPPGNRASAVRGARV